MSRFPEYETWPELQDRYDQALKEAMQYIESRFQPSGILVAGTIIAGNPDPSSDFDIHVLHDKPVRLRVQKFFTGVPAEIFVNPPSRIEEYFVEDEPGGRPMAAHMFATGIILLDKDGALKEIRQEAQQILEKKMSATLEQLTVRKYTAATFFEDATDVSMHDPATFDMIMSAAVRAMIEYYFISHGEFIPRPKTLLRELSSQDKDLGALAHHFFLAADKDEKLNAATAIADLTIGTRGFFEWESLPEKVSV